MGAYNNDVLFIHIPKCGGWSCKQYMMEYLPDVLYPDTKREDAVADSKLPIGHVPLKDIEQYTGRTPDSFQRIIAVVRNPYEQQLSQWQFWRNRYAKGHRHDHDIWAASCPDMTLWLQGKMCDFHLWYEYRFHPGDDFQRKAGPEGGYEDFGGYYHYWLEVDGVVPSNVGLCRFENLEAEFKAAVAPFADKELGTFPHANAARYDSRDKWWHYYRHEKQPEVAIELVEQKFAWTFDTGLYPKTNRKDPDIVGEV